MAPVRSTWINNAVQCSSFRWTLVRETNLPLLARSTGCRGPGRTRVLLRRRSAAHRRGVDSRRCIAAALFFNHLAVMLEPPFSGFSALRWGCGRTVIVNSHYRVPVVLAENHVTRSKPFSAFLL